MSLIHGELQFDFMTAYICLLIASVQLMIATY